MEKYVKSSKLPEAKDFAHSISGWDKPEATTDENEDYIPTEDVDLVPFSDLDDD